MSTIKCWIAGLMLSMVVPIFAPAENSGVILPAGTTLWVDCVGTRPTRQYFSLAEAYRSAEGRSTDSRASDAQLALHEALRDSMRHRFDMTVRRVVDNQNLRHDHLLDGLCWAQPTCL